MLVFLVATNYLSNYEKLHISMKIDASTLAKKKNIVGGDGVTGIAPLNVVGISIFFGFFYL
jgi:hypothetical protein